MHLAQPLTCLFVYYAPPYFCWLDLIPHISQPHAEGFVSWLSEGTSVDDEAGTNFTPGILAGLNDRSQSAYACPAPNPVPSAMGHPRPIVI